MMRLACVLVLAACGAPAEVEPGTYRETKYLQQDSAANYTNPDHFFTILEEGGGINTGMTAVVMKPDGDGYRYENYWTRPTTCPGTFVSTCVYEHELRTARAPATGEVRIEVSIREFMVECAQRSIDCVEFDAAMKARLACNVPSVLEGVRVAVDGGV